MWLDIKSFKKEQTFIDNANTQESDTGNVRLMATDEDKALKLDQLLQGECCVRCAFRVGLVEDSLFLRFVVSHTRGA